ncbi:hypothetical protein I6F30_30830 [Bradyrhizobium sp. NBAIM20]|uniref:hypothetical protein n=1 Tax=unclassified Bradyrhizobium TaxID=2631580 RepID=UPI001CD37AC6|nr:MULTISPECIES: hypothetical protein [unclassified Bradyrhizobium]MCA1415492.1 hypothetical protein [Bradyrhizobium sp. NBAIM20]MCA1460884.1 hypothetical protein [Bradyrhizobium sp. NBAIM18]
MEQEQQGGAGPSDAVGSGEVKDRLDAVNQEPESIISVSAGPNEAQIPLYQDYASALTAYNEIDPADAALKEAAYGAVKSAFGALAAPLKHTQDRLWDLPAATASRHGHRGQEVGARED